jgi:hypothetical protein
LGSGWLVLRCPTTLAGEWREGVTLIALFRVSMASNLCRD